jgi:membrane-associated phospholipid phosphatase
MYVGAHLPLDIIGGAALGAIAGSVVNLVVRPRSVRQLHTDSERQQPS